MKKSIVVAVLGMFAVLASAGVPGVKVTQEDGFVDLEFKVRRVEQLQDGARSVVVHGDLDGKPVGFAVEFRRNWKRRQIEGTADSVYWGSARFVSTGGDTDRFVEALARMYGMAAGHRLAKLSVDAEVVGLKNDPADMASAPTRMKFFFQGDGSDAQYSEVFIHTDLVQGILHFNEKDLEYRAPLVKNLAK